MTQTQTRTFMGIEIEGDINQGENRAPQRPVEELQPIIQAVLDDPTIVEFGWIGYTPFFNDGEPCRFSVRQTWVKTVEDDDRDEEEYSEGFAVSYGDGALGHFDWSTKMYQGSNEPRYLLCKALETAVEGGEFNDVLLSLFGDHAKVTVRRSGITVDYYEHD